MLRTTFGLIPLLMMLVFQFDHAPSAASDDGVAFESMELASPAGEGSRTPNLSSGGGMVYLSWLATSEKGDSVLQYSAWNGSVWTAPRTIASGSDFFTNWADFPSLLPLSDGSLAAHWLLKEADRSYGAWVGRLKRGEETWEAAVRPYSARTPSEYGFVSMVDEGNGRLGAVWLDGRKYAAAGSEATHEMALMYAARDAGPFEGEVILDARVCDCCQTAAAATSSGLFVAYRDRTASEVRDIAFVRRVDGRWTAPNPLHRDGWQIPACPVNGPAVSARGNRLAVAWFTLAPDARVQVLFSMDGGSTFGLPLRVDQGKPLGRVDIEWVDNGAALVSWLEKTTEVEAEIRVREVRPDGTLGDSLRTATTASSRSSGFPRLAVAGDEALLAWTDPEGPGRVRTARITRR